MIHRIRWLVTACRISVSGGIAALCAMSTVYAADPPSPTVGTLFNWYYATSFGTGAYTIGDTTVTVLSVPFRYTMREASETRWGWRLTVPTAVATGNFDLYNPDLSRINEIHLAALTVMPGVEFITPIRPHWRLNTFANLGHAWEFDSKAGATIYQAGTSTHYRFPTMTNPAVEVGAKYIYAGYSANGSDSTPVSLAALGVAASFPTPWTLADGRQVNIGLHWIGTSYLTNIRFRLPEFGYTEVQGEYEVGVTLGLRPMAKILGMSFDRIGLGYVVTSSDLRGIRLVTDFPF